ncbi:MAG: hypothetical protein ACRDGM_18080 [bacterium]
MPTEITQSAYGEWRTAAASTGLAVTTTRKTVALPKGTEFIRLIPRNFSTAVVVICRHNPWLDVLKTTDALATATDYSENAQDGDTATTVLMNSFDTAANNNYLYVGSHLPFAGVNVTIGNTNSIASVLTVNYWNGAWVTTGATDGTIATGFTFGQSGLVTWAVPADWLVGTLRAIVGAGTGAAIPHQNETLYWTRWQVSVAFDASVTATEFTALNRSTSGIEIPSTFDHSQKAHRGFKGFGAVEAVTDAGTANLIINCLTMQPNGKFS